MLIDDQLSRWDVRSAHDRFVAAAPGAVYDAALRTDFARPPLVRALIALRGLPARIFGGQQREPLRTDDRRTIFGLGFTVLAEDPPRELVLGLQGRFWKPTGNVEVCEPKDFHGPVPVGRARAVWNLRVEPEGAGSRLATETRVLCGDEASRRSFTRYWRVIGPFSGLIRVAVLREIAREAERGS